MVVGNTTRFSEGFKSISVDDELLLVNLKNALNYSVGNLAIPNIPQSQDSDNMQKNTALNYTNKSDKSDNAPNKLDMSVIPMQTPINTSNNNSIIPQSTSYSSAIPLSKQTGTSQNNSVNSKKSQNSSTLSAPNTLNMSVMPLKTNIISGVNSTPKNTTLTSNNKSDNKISKFKNTNENTDDIDGEHDINDRKNNNYDTDENDEDDEDDGYDDDENDGYGTDNNKHNIETFQGSVIIERKQLKNILLALLLSFIAYLIVHMCINNVIPITEISPQLKKFKNMIYGFIFFIISYICLEVF